MKTDTNIVFVHEGFSWHLPYALEQARTVAKSTDIHLLGSGYQHKGVQVAKLASLESKSSKNFREAYRHMSTNPEWYELVCWLRWFFLLQYMDSNKLESVLYLDSDVLLFSTFGQICASWGDEPADCALLVPKSQPAWPFDLGIASGHTSYWTVSSLRSFCDYSIETFTSKTHLEFYQRYWEYHQKNGISGGVCDMVTLGMFYNANKNRVANLALPRNGTVFDYNINQGRNHDENDYYVEAGAKKVLKINGEPYIVRNENPYVLHKAHTLHFQGRGKMKMPTLFTGKNFIGQWRCRILRAREIAKNRVASLIR